MSAREGLLRRILRGLGVGARPGVVTVTETRTTEIRTERIEIRDPQTGQVRVYGSIGEVPPEIRAMIEEARRKAQAGGVGTKITIIDASGTKQTYNSVDEMSPEIRAIYERLQRER